MLDLKFYCLKYSRLADRILSIYKDENSYNDWDYFIDNYRNKNLHLTDKYVFPSIEVEKKNKPLSDFYFLGGIFIISQKAKDILSEFILPTCQILPFHKIEDELFFAINCFNPIDCIDYEKSKFYIYPSSPEVKLNQGEPIYFQEDKVPEDIFFFKVPLEDSEFYCKKEFVEKVLEHKLLGLGFRDPRVHELSSISGNAENPVPEVEKFKLSRPYSQSNKKPQP